MPDQELRMRAKFEGGDQAAGELKKVDEAQKKVGKTTSAQTKAVKQATTAQKKLNAGTSDYAELLSRVHPALGAMFMSAVQGGKILSDLANQKLSLTSITKKMGSAILGAGNAIKLLGATGVAVVGLTILWKVIAKVRRETQRAHEAIQKMIVAQTEWAEKSIHDAQAVAAARDEASQRRRPFSFAQQESVRATLDAAPEDVRERLKSITRALGGAVGFGRAPGEFRGTDLEMLARLGWQPEPEAPQWSNVASAQTFLTRRQDDAAVIETRRREERAALRQRAVQEAVGEGWAGRPNLRALITEKAAGLGLDGEIDRLVEIAIKQIREDVKLRADEGGYQLFELASTPGARGASALPQGRGVGFFESPLWGTGGPRAGGESLTTPQALALTEALRELTTEIRAHHAVPGAANIQAAMVNVHPTSASVQRAEICNGQNWADRMGIEGN